MGTKAYTPNGNGKPNGKVKPIYKDMKARKVVLILGFLMTLAAFALVFTAMLNLFVPGLSFAPAGITPFMFCIYLYGVGTGLAFLGVVFAVAGANTVKWLARLSFFMGIMAFLFGFALLIISLFFNTILPIEAFNRLML